MSTMTDDRPAADRRILRFVAFGIAVVLAVSGLTTRLFYLQITNVAQGVQQVAADTTVTQEIPSTRGLIYDRIGRPLVVNEPSYAVKIRPADLPDTERDRVVAELATLLKMSVGDINTAIDSNPGSRFDLVRIAQAVPKATADLIAEESASLPGVVVSVETQRQYLDGPLLSQILGYTGPIDAQELSALQSQGYLPDDLIGKTGVESVYEQQLRGTYGTETVQRDASGRPLQVLQTNQQPVPGDSLQLTIDVKEQKLAQQAVDWALNTAHLKSAVLIVENPQTGEILAMVSEPTYDNNAFATGISSKAYQALLNDPNQPLLNHAIAEQFPPGSTYKLVTATGALADKKITPTETFHTASYIYIGNTKFWDWHPGGFGDLSLQNGFAYSSDTFFYQVAAMVGDLTLAKYARAFGFGQAKSIEMPGVMPGLVPDSIWKQLQCGVPDLNSDSCRWTEGDTITFGIGQSYLLTTPLNQAIYVAALANGGQVLKPTLVHEVRDDAGRIVATQHPVVTSTVPASPQTIQAVREGMREEINPPYNMNYSFRAAGVPADGGGKTGTAQWGGSGLDLPTHAWFVFFAPYSSPDIAMSIFVERGELSEVEAAPIAVDIMKFYRANRAAVRAP